MQQKEKQTSPAVLTLLPIPETIPATGFSSWRQIKKFSPYSREKFRQLSIEGKAPPPIRDGIRCTFYDNRELHRWLADPINYRVEE